MAQPFDAQRLELTGDPLPVAEHIQTGGDPALAYFSASKNGVLAYQTGAAAAGSQLMWFDRAGHKLSALGEPAPYDDVQLSPDGRQASVSLPGSAADARDIWIYDVACGLRTRFTFDPGIAFQSVWSPDGSHIIFNSSQNGHVSLYEKASNGAGAEELLLNDEFGNTPAGWSPDGHFLLYLSNGRPTGYDLFLLPLSGDRKPVAFLNTKFNEHLGRFSPDGRWIVYYSDESGRFEVYVAPFPGPGGKRQISTTGGNKPRWRGRWQRDLLSRS